jgi:sulfate permease, SulP family
MAQPAAEPVPPARGLERLVPAWIGGYRREWLVPDVVAGIVVWSVVVPQAAAYAQIAGLPPEAGLIAAPGALLGYALVGSSRSLIVSATTATSAISASAIAPLAHGDTARFAALSAALALVSAVVLGLAAVLRVGGVADLVSKPVMTGFMFGLGITIAVGQIPKLLGIDDRDGNVFPKLWRYGSELGKVSGLTAAVGLVSIAVLVLLPHVAPRVPATLALLVVAIAISALFDLSSHGVAVVGTLGSAYPHPALPDVSGHDLIDLVGPALGVMVLTTEAVGVSRAIAGEQGVTVDPNRELLALGTSNLLAGLSSGFVQSGGASQTAAAERAGNKTQLAAVTAAALIVLTGLFLAPLFKDLPEATLGAIVVVAVSGFWRADELRRFARVRTSALVFALVSLAGVLALGVLRGLVVAALVSLVDVIRRLSRPSISVHQEGDRILARVNGPLFYANVPSVKDRLLALDAASVVVLDVSLSSDFDVQTLDGIVELRKAFERDGVEFRLTGVREHARRRLERAGVTVSTV